jgi:hypothetical protein
MSPETSPPNTPQPPPTRTVPIHITPSGWKALRLYEKEIATYRRELPRLLAEGYAGEYALVKGDEILSVWETQGDAIRAGSERFGLEPIFVKKIDPRDPDRYALLDAYLEAQKKGSSCPS